ncbi:MAG: hypothetical protein ACRDIX_09155 [Actinomycetota bacterium]
MRRARRLAVAGVLFALLMGSTAPAAAHIAIRLDIRAPQPGQRVPPDTSAVIFAQRMLGGRDRVDFTVTLDGRTLDPETGRVGGTGSPATIEVDQTLRIPLRSLATGSHALTVTYRPDTDAPILENSVEFVVGESSGAPFAVAAVGSIAVLALASMLLMHRRRRSLRLMGQARSGLGYSADDTGPLADGATEGI